MTALVRIQLGLRRLPAGIPYGISILNIQIFAVDVCRYIIVTITGQTQQFGILIEGISAAGVGYQTEKLVASQIVDPGKRSLGSSDDIFLMHIIKMTILHKKISFFHVVVC